MPILSSGEKCQFCVAKADVEVTYVTCELVLVLCFNCARGYPGREVINVAAARCRLL